MAEKPSGASGNLELVASADEMARARLKRHIESRSMSAFLRYVEVWLHRNSRRFKHPPVLVRRRRNSLDLRFEGVSSSIRLSLTAWGSADIHAFKRNKHWDILTEFDVVTAQAASGAWYCELCIEPIYYASRQQLWTQHTMQPLLSWANAHFRHSMRLYLYGEDDWTAAKIVPAIAIIGDLDYADLCAAYRVVCGHNARISFSRINRNVHARFR